MGRRRELNNLKFGSDTSDLDDPFGLVGPLADRYK
jgi:hypothetical protein